MSKTAINWSFVVGKSAVMLQSYMISTPENGLYKELLIFRCHNVHEFIYVGYRMHASELLQALENSAIEVLDNQAVMDTMTGGVETSAAFGAMGF